MARDPDAALVAARRPDVGHRRGAAGRGAPAGRAADAGPLAARAGRAARHRPAAGGAGRAAAATSTWTRRWTRCVGARAEQRPPHLDELIARDWGRPELALCLLVDDSGLDDRRPARGGRDGDRRVRVARPARARRGRLRPRRAPAAHAARSPRRPTTVVDRVLRLRGHGVTGLAGALRFGAEALADARAQPAGSSSCSPTAGRPTATTRCRPRRRSRS